MELEEDDRGDEDIPNDDVLMEFELNHQSASPRLTTIPHTPKREKKQLLLLERQVDISEQFLNNASGALQSITSSQSDVSMHLRSIKHEFRKLIDLKEKEYKDKNVYRKMKLEILEKSCIQKGMLKKEQFELQKLNIEVLQTANELKRLKLNREDE